MFRNAFGEWKNEIMINNVGLYCLRAPEQSHHTNSHGTLYLTQTNWLNITFHVCATCVYMRPGVKGLKNLLTPVHSFSSFTIIFPMAEEDEGAYISPYASVCPFGRTEKESCLLLDRFILLFFKLETLIWSRPKLMRMLKLILCRGLITACLYSELCYL